MGRHRAAGLIIHHLIGVAVVCADEHLSVHLADGFDGTADAGIHCLDGLDGCLFHAGVSHHVGVREVDDDDIILAGADGLAELVANLRRTHLGLQIIGGNLLRGGNQHPILAGVRLFHAAVEEEGDVSVLLCLRDAALGHVVGCQVFAKGVLQLLLLERHQLVGDQRIVIRKADIDNIRSLFSREEIKFIIAEGVGDLSCPVGAEIEEDHGIAVLDGGGGLTILLHIEGDDKLIGHFAVIGCLDAAGGALCRYAHAFGEYIPGLHHAVIVLVTVHGIVASHHGSNFTNADLLHLLFQLCHISLCGSGRRISAVQEAVDIDFCEALALCELQKPVEMLRVAVHAAGANQSEQMQGGPVLFAVFRCSQEFRILEEVAVSDLLGDSGQLLVYHPAGAHVHVADLGVAHLSVGKADRQTAGVALHKGAVLHQLIQHRLVCQSNRIVLRALIQAEAVKYHQYCRSLVHTIFLVKTVPERCRSGTESLRFTCS